MVPDDTVDPNASNKLDKETSFGDALAGMKSTGEFATKTNYSAQHTTFKTGTIDFEKLGGDVATKPEEILSFKGITTVSAGKDILDFTSTEDSFDKADEIDK